VRNHTFTLGAWVHYVADDYEAPAMIVGTSNHFDDEDDCLLQYGHDGRSEVGITLVVHHPWTRELLDVETQEVVRTPITELVVDPDEDSTTDLAGTYHWPDQCPIT